MNLNFVKGTIEDKWDDSMGRGGLILIILFVLAIVFGICCLCWWIEWLLWGAIMVKVFGLPALTFWQMAGLGILLNILIPHSISSSKSKAKTEVN